MHHMCITVFIQLEKVETHSGDSKKKGGFGWANNLKMITCDKQTYGAEVLVWNLYKWASFFFFFEDQ